MLKQQTLLFWKHNMWEPTNGGNSVEEITRRLIEPVVGTYRNITGDNWF